MSTTRRVDPNDPSAPYDTPQEAHDDGAPGDTIEIAPGTYGQLMMTKRMHVRGDTDDPSQVVIAQPAPLRETIVIALGDEALGDLFIEGITIDTLSASNGIGISLKSTYNGSEGTNLYINRVVFKCGVYGTAIESTNRVLTVFIKLINCTAAMETNWYVIFGKYSQSSEIELIALETPAGELLFGGISPGVTDVSEFAVWLADRVETPTVGYGVGYGDWYASQYQEGYLYGIPVQVNLTSEQRVAGILPDQWEFRVYRERDTGAREDFPIARLTPDSASGVGEFAYLPSVDGNGDPARYWIDWTGPEGFAPGLHGPYAPIPSGGG